jgi:hypothetical protein
VTFGELAIGDLFWWTARDGGRGPEPMRKTTAARYEWSRGFGTVEAHVPVEVYVEPGQGSLFGWSTWKGDR